MAKRIPANQIRNAVWQKLAAGLAGKPGSLHLSRTSENAPMPQVVLGGVSGEQEGLKSGGGSSRAAVEIFVYGAPGSEVLVGDRLDEICDAIEAGELTLADGFAVQWGDATEWGMVMGDMDGQTVIRGRVVYSFLISVPD